MFPPAPDVRVFYANGNHVLVNSTIFGRRVKMAAEAAGVSLKRAHLLRHFCATRLIEAGASVKQVQDHMRHANAQETLDTYAWPTDLSALGLTSTA